MTRRLWISILLLLSLAVLTTSALADSGPKPLLSITVEYPPEKLYYLDLLAEGPPYEDGYRTEEDFAGYDQTLLQAMRSAAPEGWHLCILDGDLIFGDLTGGPRGDAVVHTFSYYGVPDTYRILIAAASGEIWVSDPCTRQVLQSSATVDWAAKTVSVPSPAAGFALQFFSTFLPTLFIEGVLLALFGYGKLRRNWIVFLAVNLVTQGLLAWYTASNTLTGGASSGAMAMVIGECVIALVEGCLYCYFLKSHSSSRAFGYAVTANACSALAGVVLVEPVWQFVVSIS